jgi:hypothetical protein
MTNVINQEHFVDRSRIASVIFIGDRNGDLYPIFVMAAHSPRMVFSFSLVKVRCFVNSFISAVMQSFYPVVRRNLANQSV